jgi:hypothetical protein
LIGSGWFSLIEIQCMKAAAHLMGSRPFLFAAGCRTAAKAP